MNLALLLTILGCALFPRAESTYVSFQHDGPQGGYGVSCNSAWRGVPGNVQSLCEGVPDGGIVIYVDHIPDYYTFLATLRHEVCHQEVGVEWTADNAWDAFHEAECYAEGFAYADEETR